MPKQINFTGNIDLLLIDYRDQLISRIDKHYRKRDLSRIDTIIVHHSGSDKSTLESMSEYHTADKPDGHGWPRLSYHFVIHYGDVFVINDIDLLTYHARGYNARSIGICIIGNYENKLPSTSDVRALHNLILILNFVLPGLKVLGHRDVSNTLCPGKNLYDVVHNLFDGERIMPWPGL